MAYCARTDLTNRFGIEIAQLIDRDNNSVDDAGVLESAIAGADAIIDGYLSGRYAVPLDPVPQLIKDISCDLSRFRLWGSNAPEGVAQANDAALALLRDIARGVIILEMPKPEQAPVNAQISISAPDRIFTSETLADF